MEGGQLLSIAGSSSLEEREKIALEYIQGFSRYLFDSYFYSEERERFRAFFSSGGIVKTMRQIKEIQVNEKNGKSAIDIVVEFLLDKEKSLTEVVMNNPAYAKNNAETLGQIFNLLYVLRKNNISVRDSTFIIICEKITEYANKIEETVQGQYGSIKKYDRTTLLCGMIDIFLMEGKKFDPNTDKGIEDGIKLALEVTDALKRKSSYRVLQVSRSKGAGISTFNKGDTETQTYDEGTLGEVLREIAIKSSQAGSSVGSPSGSSAHIDTAEYIRSVSVHSLESYDFRIHQKNHEERPEGVTSDQPSQPSSSQSPAQPQDTAPSEQVSPSTPPIISPLPLSSPTDQSLLTASARESVNKASRRIQSHQPPATASTSRTRTRTPIPDFSKFGDSSSYNIRSSSARDGTRSRSAQPSSRREITQSKVLPGIHPPSQQPSSSRSLAAGPSSSRQRGRSTSQPPHSNRAQTPAYSGNSSGHQRRSTTNPNEAPGTPHLSRTTGAPRSDNYRAEEGPDFSLPGVPDNRLSPAGLTPPNIPTSSNLRALPQRRMNESEKPSPSFLKRLFCCFKDDDRSKSQ